jgi:hypothetical protein
MTVRDETRLAISATGLAPGNSSAASPVATKLYARQP